MDRSTVSHNSNDASIPLTVIKQLSHENSVVRNSVTRSLW